MKYRTVIVAAMVLALVAAWSLPAVAAEQFKITTVVAPLVGLDRVEVQSYFGFWLGTKEKPGEKGGAPLVLAFVFNVMNPNSLPVNLEELMFTYAFEGYDLNTPIYTNPMWIPAGKTNQVRVVSTVDTSTVNLNLLVTSGFKLKEQGVKSGDLIKKWWTSVIDMAFPIEVKYGKAQFAYEGGEVTSTFVGTFGGK